MEPEQIKQASNTLQQASLKLFEQAYKKVCNITKTSLKLRVVTTGKEQRALLQSPFRFY